jgi:hypothetical protein
MGAQHGCHIRFHSAICGMQGRALRYVEFFKTVMMAHVIR